MIGPSFRYCQNPSTEFVLSGTTMLSFAELKFLFPAKDISTERHNENSIVPEVTNAVDHFGLYMLIGQ